MLPVIPATKEVAMIERKALSKDISRTEPMSCIPNAAVSRGKI